MRLLDAYIYINPIINRCYYNPIVFEDLRRSGYSMDGAFNFDEETTKSALSAAARLHALSMLAESNLGKPLCEIFPNLVMKDTYRYKYLQIGSSLETVTNSIVEIANQLGLDSSKISTFFNRTRKIIDREVSILLLCIYLLTLGPTRRLTTFWLYNNVWIYMLNMSWKSSPQTKMNVVESWICRWKVSAQNPIATECLIETHSEPIQANNNSWKNFLIVHCVYVR